MPKGPKIKLNDLVFDQWNAASVRFADHTSESSQHFVHSDLVFEEWSSPDPTLANGNYGPKFTALVSKLDAPGMNLGDGAVGVGNNGRVRVFPTKENDIDKGGNVKELPTNTLSVEKKSINVGTNGEIQPTSFKIIQMNATSRKATISELNLLRKLQRNPSRSTKNMDILMKDTNASIKSAESFEDLNLKPQLLKRMQEMGITRPSEIQSVTIPTLLAIPPQSIIVECQPKSGKTTAFTVAALNRVDAAKKYPQVLYLCPTDDMASKIGESMANFYPEAKIIYAMEGEEISAKTQLTAQIVVGTPRIVLDWAFRYRVFDLAKLAMFVIDDADEIIRNGFQKECIEIYRDLSPVCQMVFCCTSYDQQFLTFMVKVVMPRRLTPEEEEVVTRVHQCYVKCLFIQEKYDIVTKFFDIVEVEQALIFCNDNLTANLLAKHMKKKGNSVAILTGELKADKSVKVLEKFISGKKKILITINDMSKGIAVDQMNVVINFDLPTDDHDKPDFDTYLHRIRRSGRLGEKGIIINIVDSQRSLNICQAIEKHFGRRIIKLPINP